MCLLCTTVGDGVNEGGPVEDFAEQYREPEHAEQYHEPEPEDPTASRSSRKASKMASSTSPFGAYLSQIYKYNLLACFINCIVLLQNTVR